MKREKILRQWIFTAGILILLTGAVHNACVGIVCSSMSCTESFIWFFLGMGTTLIFTGLLILYAAGGLKRFETWGWHIALASGIFTAVLGIIGVSLAEYGAFILVVLALLELISVGLYRRHIFRPASPTVG